MRPALLVAAMLFFISSFAQSINSSDIRSHLKPAQRPVRSHNPGYGAARSSEEVWVLDYDSVDLYAANALGDSTYIDAWPINHNLPTDSEFTLRYALINFDSLIYYGNNGGFDWSAREATQLRLDSFDTYLSHENFTGNEDTLIISVLSRSSVQIVGTGINSSVTGTVLWADTFYSSGPIFPTNNFYTVTLRPNIQLPRGESFSIRYDFHGDPQNHLSILSSYRYSCGFACGADISAIPKNSWYYVNHLTLPGVNSIPGVSCSFPDTTKCRQFYLQNILTYAYVTANVGFGVGFAADTVPLCSGSAILHANAFGAEGPVSYRWSPATGLSSTTNATVTVSGLSAGTTYTAIATDSVGNTDTASVFVTLNQAGCIFYDTISGMVYFDINNNGQHDNGEPGYSNTYVIVDNNYVVTDTNGYYTIALRNLQTSHTVLFNDLQSYTWLNQPANNGEYTLAADSNYTDINFGIHFSPDTNNVRVSLVNYSLPPRPGFSSYYNLYYENTLGTDFTGAVSLHYDSALSFINAQPTPTTINTTTHIATWDVSLATGRSDYIYLELKTPVTGMLGRVIYQTAIITPNATFTDIDYLDNTFTLEEVVVGSYDPNDKAVSPVGVGATNSILPGKELTYTIRFQNTGTFYAENVAVADTMDTDMDMSTFRMINASHKYMYTKEGNIITWHFNKIMLPDSNQNEPGSHGFIQYKIGPKPTITHLSVIENTAFIYFDFNTAIITNTTSNLVDFYLGVHNVAKDAIGVQVFPNPFSGQTNFSINSLEQNLTLRITDITGRTLDEIKNVPTPYYAYQNDKLAKGVYNFDLRNNESIKARGKLVVQ